MALITAQQVADAYRALATGQRALIAPHFAEDYSADVTNNTGHRAGEPNCVLGIDVVHGMRWRDGKVIRPRGAIFGDGTAQYDTFWA
jgi:hypothetical protein